jgi:hypothetical protein
MTRKPHKHQDPHSNELRECSDSECKLPFRSFAPRPVYSRPRKVSARYASREEQHARYIDCGPAAWDDR